MGMRTRAPVRARLRAAAALALALAHSGCDAARDGSSPPVRAGTISLADAEIWYQSIGAGAPIIAIHGGPGLDHTYLMPGLERLGAVARLILYDQRGLGSSRAVLDSTSITMTRFLDDIDAVRDRVAGTARVTLLAHSWGSIPALLYAMRWPERVEALVLVSPVEPGQRYAAEAAAAQDARRTPADRAAIDSLMATAAFRDGDRATTNRVFFHVFRGTFADPTVADRSFRPRLMERTTVQGRTVAALLMAPLAGLDFWDELPALDVPALLVHGAADPIPLEMVREMEAALPSARLVTIEGAGHFPFVEKPDEFLAAVVSFLEERASPTAP